MHNVELYLISAIVVAIPILYATIGEILTQKSGNMNLGVEGMMLIGAVIGFKVAYITNNPGLSLFAAGLAGMVAALLYGFLTVTLRCNQVVTGLTLTIFGGGFSSFVGKQYVGERLSSDFVTFFDKRPIPLLSDIPFVGEILFNQDVLMYAVCVVTAIVSIYLYKTKFGLNLKIVGENPGAADSLGLSVVAYKYAHILVSGILCGIGGAYISLALLPTWQENIVAGKGWIAVTLVIFSKWNPIRASLGAVFFGLLSILGIRLQKYDLPISQYFFDMLPYISTIIILFIGELKKSKVSAEPASLGQAYFRESR